MNFDRDVIFNEGCDARVLGLSWKENPYIGTPLDEHKRIWFDGWNHVNIFWGRDSNSLDVMLLLEVH